MNRRGIDDLKIGEKATFSKTISETDVYLYAGISGDTNPLHLDQEYAQNSLFKGRIAHGMLVMGLISAVLGTRLPGPGTIWVSQSIRFLAPVRFGDTITATCEVTSIDAKRNRVTLRTFCTNQKGKMVVDGEAVVIPPSP